MRRMVVGGAFSLLFLLAVKNSGAQVSNPYHLNGSATQNSCHCYTLTEDVRNESGSLWNINKIDLTQSFDFKFNVFLGCTDANGADGIVFVLQPISTSVGSVGQGLGYAGISPSIGIAIDTWQNIDDNDPSYDNISILKNGNIIHSITNDVAMPVPVLESGGNIEDCAFHTFRITWNASTKLLATQIDGADRVSATIDLVKDIFGNDPLVFWGFTGATGGSSNKQRVCTSLNPIFSIPEGESVCYPTPINFIDSSTSFGTIDKWYWDFGDGTTDSVPNPPTHIYSKPGKYDVKLSIVGNDECLSDPGVKTIVLGSKPVAGYRYIPAQPCKGVPVTISDSSAVEFGTIDKWNWSIAGTKYSTEDPGAILLSGTNRVELTVGTLEGCVSEQMDDSLTILPLPCPEFYVPSAFSPNRDGHNDVFKFVAGGMASVEMFNVFNRYGQLVYSSADIHAAWDGKYKGTDQPCGAYIYLIRGKDLNGKEHSKKGTVILVR
jgi:gliding motility-associated-like protein